VLKLIPVSLQKEPRKFNTRVRQKGHAWLNAAGIALNAPPPDPSKLPNYWTETNFDLWERYNGICAYLAIFFEFATGASSTDHFVAKSKNAGMAYEWDNYRLSCLGPNRNKNKFDDVIDPMGMSAEVFFLNLSSGRIKPNPNLKGVQRKLAMATIARLDLNSAVNKKMRAKHYSNYVSGQVAVDYLKTHSPFVWYEAQRQNLL
jgi:uncharacterized protein (TIGR02646 family)